MFNPTSFKLFFVTCIILVMTPGPDTLYVLARSLGHGRRAGIISAIGICTGFLVHTSAAVIGLSAILMASATAFKIIKFACASYLIYLGARSLTSKTIDQSVPQSSSMAYRQFLTQGFLTNVLNPKVPLFFLAFIPQFVDPTRSTVASQVIVYGINDMGISLLWLCGIAIITSSTRQ